MRREERLAHGPRGDVWRVVTPEGRVMVAKQAIKPTRGERAQLRDLVRRGRTLQLPLVPFVDFHDAGGDVWVVREFDSGVPLSKLALNSPLSHRQAAGTAAACLQALAQLYEAGLCHGRVHGGNVFVEPDGSIRIVDAGIGAPRHRRDQRGRWADDMKATAALVYTVWPDWEYEAGRLIYDLLEAGRMGDAAAASQGLELLAASLPPAENKPSADLALAALGVRLLEGRAVPVLQAPAPPAVVTPEPEEVGASAGSPALKAWTVAPLDRPPMPPLSKPASAPSIAKPPTAQNVANPPDVAPPPSPPPVEQPPLPEEIAAASLPAQRVPPRGPYVAPPPAEGAVYVWVPTPPRGALGPRGSLAANALQLVESLREAASRFMNDRARRPASVPDRRPPRVASRSAQQRSRVAPRSWQPPSRVRPALIGGVGAAASVAVVVGVAIGHAVAPQWPPRAQALPKLAPPPADSGSPHPSPAAPAPAGSAGTLQPAAPASEGFVRQVELVPLTDCATGGHCTFKSVLHLQSPHAAASLTWDLVAVDRCSGAQSVVSSDQSTLDPSWNQVWASDQLSLPSSHPTMLYAVAESPYRAASSPVEIAGSAACTPGA